MGVSHPVKEKTMITKTSEKQLAAAIKRTLRVGDKVANGIVADNWMRLPVTSLRGAVVTVLPESRALEVYAPCTGDLEGYHMPVATLTVDGSALARWNQLPIEEAYGLPEGVKLGTDMESFDGKVLSFRPRDEDGIIVETLDFATGEVRDMVMLAGINDAPGLLAYAAEIKEEGARLYWEPNPIGSRSRKAAGLPILEMVLTGSNRIDENGEEPFVDLDELFGPIPEAA